MRRFMYLPVHPARLAALLARAQNPYSSPFLPGAGLAFYCHALNRARDSLPSGNPQKGSSYTARWEPKADALSAGSPDQLDPYHQRCSGGLPWDSLPLFLPHLPA